MDKFSILVVDDSRDALGKKKRLSADRCQFKKLHL